MNSELSKLHNKKNNIKKEENESLINIDLSNQDKVLRECLKNFIFSYSSIIGIIYVAFKKMFLFVKNVEAYPIILIYLIFLQLT